MNHDVVGKKQNPDLRSPSVLFDLHLQDLVIKLVDYHVVLWVALIHQLLHAGVLASTVYSAKLLYP